MPIDFACPSCSRQYRVKDELAGKNAKCGKCGHRMPIPQLAASISATARTNAPASTKSAPVKAPTAAKSGPPKTVPTKQVTAKAAQKLKSSAGSNSWLDEELEASQSTVVKAPLGPRTPCPSCGQPLAAGAVLCVACGYDTRTRTKMETKHETDGNEAVGKKRQRPIELSYAASLLRGTVFSFLGAMLGATLWAVLAYFTMKEFVFMAWVLGGLTGLGMALGHEDDDGTNAGIIAAFMSLFGIVAAKILIIVIFVAGAVAGVVGQMNVDAGDPLEFKRMIVAGAVAEEKLEAQGIDPEEATEAQWEQATAEAEAEIANLDENALDARIESLDDEEAEEEMDEIAEAEIDSAPPEVQPQQDGMEEVAIAEDVAPPNFIKLFFESMFDPFDSIFILLAFFTAYKVGSGVMSD